MPKVMQFNTKSVGMWLKCLAPGRLLNCLIMPRQLPLAIDGAAAQTLSVDGHAGCPLQILKTADPTIWDDIKAKQAKRADETATQAELRNAQACQACHTEGMRDA